MKTTLKTAQRRLGAMTTTAAADALSVDEAPHQPHRVATRLRIERGRRIPAEGETVMMERELSHHAVAVTVHRITRMVEHTGERGVWLMDAVVSMRDLATHETGAWLLHSTTRDTQATGATESEVR